MQPTTIEFPRITVGARVFFLRMNYTALYQLGRWGRNLASASTIELAAAMANEPDAAGKMRNAGFERPTDFADLIEDDAGTPTFQKEVGIAVKNRYPELEILFQPLPEPMKEPTGSPESSAPGPSLEAVTALDSQS